MLFSSPLHHSAPPVRGLQELRSALLATVQSAPGDVLEELKSRLQLKDRLFQEVLSDRTRQAEEHQEQVEELLRTISSRDQYIQVDLQQPRKVLKKVLRSTSRFSGSFKEHLKFSASSVGSPASITSEGFQKLLKVLRNTS